MAEIAYLVIGGVLWNNIVLTNLLGLFPFFGDHPDSVADNAVLGLVTTAVIAVAVISAHFVRILILIPADLLFLEHLVMMLLVLAITMLADRLWRTRLGYILPRVFMNGAAFGLVLLQLDNWNGLISTLASSIGFGLGITFLLIVVAAITIRPESRLVPPWLQGMPLQLMTLGMIALALTGFAGI